MASLGSLVVSLAMDTARFTGDVGKAAQQMARLTNEAAKIGAAIGANIGIAAVAFKNLVMGAIDAADAASKLAVSLGMSTEETSRYLYIADLAGLSSEEFAGAMQKVAKQAADVAAGVQGASDIFDAMGINVKKADGSLKSQSDLLGDIADKFATYRSSTERTALAVELFGKQGAKLVPFLVQGREGLKQLGEEADMLGITLSTKAGAAAEQFNDNLTRLNAAQQGFGRRVAELLLPALQSLTDRLFDNAKNANTFGRAAEIAATGVKLLFSAATIGVAVFDTLGTAIGGVVGAVVALLGGRWREAWDIAQNTVLDVKGNITSYAKSVADVWATTVDGIKTKSEDLNGKITAPVIRGDQLRKAAADASKASDAYQRLADEVGKAVNAAQAEVGMVERLTPLQALRIKLEDALRDAKQKFTAAQRQSIQAQIDSIGVIDEEIAKQRELIRVVEERAAMRAKDYQDAEDAARANEQAERDRLRGMVSATPTGRMEQTLRDIDFLNRMLEQGKISVEVWAEAARNATSGIGAAANEVNDTAKQLGMTFQSAFEDAIVEGKKFSDVLKSLEKDLVRLLVRKFVTEPWANAISNWAGGLMSGGSATGGGGTSNWLGSLLNMAGSFFAGSGANGVYIPPGKWGWVGENGAEPAFGGRSGLTVGGNAQAQQTINVNVQAQAGMSRATALQQGEQIGRGIRVAMARNG